MVNLFDLLHLSAPLDFIGQTSINDCIGTAFTKDSYTLSCANHLSQETAKNWDLMWNNKIGIAGGEFVAAMNISRYIAGPAVILWGANAIKNMHRNGMASGWQQAASVVILVMVLYTNQAYVLRQSTLAIRALFNYQNRLVLEATNASSQYEQHLAEIIDYRMSEDKIREIRSQCDGMTTNQTFKNCLEEANVAAAAAIKEFETAHPLGKFGAKLNVFAQGIIDEPLKAATKAAKEATVAATLGPAAYVGGYLYNVGTSMVTQGMLSGMNYVAQNVVELSWLLTALIAPVPLALSFYPGTRGALIAWVVGYMTLGLFKINLNIATSVIVSMLYERGPGAGTTDLMLLSFGVIGIAGLMTAGGGIAIFNGIMGGIAAVSLAVVNIGASAAKGVIGG